MERWEAKIIAIAVSLILPFIFVLLPYPMASYVESKGKLGQVVINRLMCFGGGIFFGAFLLHMGPEVSLLTRIILYIAQLLSWKELNHN